MKDYVFMIVGLLALAIIVCGVTYSCTLSTQTYRELANNCISAGGSWMNANGGSGICIAPKGK